MPCLSVWAHTQEHAAAIHTIWTWLTLICLILTPEPGLPRYKQLEALWPRHPYRC